MVWIVVALLVGALIIAAAVSPSAPKQAPQELETGSFPIAKEGVPVPVVFGTVLLLEPNCVWWGDVGYTPVKTKSGK